MTTPLRWSALFVLAVSACASGGAPGDEDEQFRVVGGPPVGDYLVVDPVTTPVEVRLSFDGFGYVMRRNGREMERGSYRSLGNRISLVPEGGGCAGLMSHWMWAWADEQLTLRFSDGRCPALLQTRTVLRLRRR
jgi:hypothetical protein